jgi:ELWxxDGT repeat protein
MKSKILFFMLSVLLGTVVAVKAQVPVFPKPNDSNQVPFGQKLPPPVLNEMNKMMSKGGVKKTWEFKPGPSISSKGQTSAKPVNPSTGFHLTKDINTSTIGSDPSNYPLNAPRSFAVLNNVSYFAASDGIHGRELWRSDGTAAGTYLVKDIYPGNAGGAGWAGIIAANGLLYFFAQDPDHGIEPWVSDGTELGTHLLKDLNPGTFSSSPTQFAAANGTVYFVGTSYNGNDQLWKTDGTETGTELVKDLQLSGLGYLIVDLTTVNEMAYFVAYTWSSGFQLFRSDGTDAGTYVVKQIGYNYDAYNVNFAQLTAYNNKLYFSVDDGSGRRLWDV